MEQTAAPGAAACMQQPELITLVVEAKSEAIFHLPSQVLSAQSAYLDRAIKRFSQQPTSDNVAPSCTLHLPKTRLCDFFDFVRWLETGRIIQYPPPATQDAGVRLVNALAFAIRFESIRYQASAMKELLALGHLLPAPEKLVEQIYEVTERCNKHPARNLIVSIVASMTGGRGSYLPAPTDERKNVARMEAIKSKEFWEMHDEYCKKRMYQCRYPSSIEEAVAWYVQ